jgi:hypothetical protein
MTPLYFARRQLHPVSKEPMAGVSVMKAEAHEIAGSPTRFCIFVSYHADLAEAMAEVRRLNETAPT